MSVGSDSGPDQRRLCGAVRPGQPRTSQLAPAVAEEAEPRGQLADRLNHVSSRATGAGTPVLIVSPELG